MNITQRSFCEFWSLLESKRKTAQIMLIGRSHEDALIKQSPLPARKYVKFAKYANTNSL